MADLLHEIEIAAPPEKVYRDLTTADGLKSWWTRDASDGSRTGSIVTFRFNQGSYVLRMHIEELAPAKRVVWTCVGDDPEWKGTRLTWELSPEEDNHTVLKFSHRGWVNTKGQFAACNTTWGHLLYLLQAHCEGKATEPLFDG